MVSRKLKKVALGWEVCRRARRITLTVILKMIGPKNGCGNETTRPDVITWGEKKKNKNLVGGRELTDAERS